MSYATSTMKGIWLVYDPEDGWEEYYELQEAMGRFDSLVELHKDCSTESGGRVALYRALPLLGRALEITARPEDDTVEGQHCRDAGRDSPAEGVVTDLTAGDPPLPATRGELEELLRQTRIAAWKAADAHTPACARTRLITSASCCCDHDLGDAEPVRPPSRWAGTTVVGHGPAFASALWEDIEESRRRWLQDLRPPRAVEVLDDLGTIHLTQIRAFEVRPPSAEIPILLWVEGWSGCYSAARIYPPGGAPRIPQKEG